MTQRDKTSQAAMLISVGSAIGTAYALLQKRAAAPLPGGQIVSLDEATMNLLIAIAQQSVKVDENTQGIIDAIEGLTLTGGLGWPPNTDSGTALRVAIAPTGTQLPYIAVPSGMALVIRAWPLNPGWLQVGFTPAECTNVNQSYPLLPNEVIGYFIQNAEAVYIAATAAGCFACLTVEQKKGGG